MSNFWKEIQNYSGCTDFEQLQQYLNIIYKFEIQLEDFSTIHPVYLAKLLHLHQLAIKYYEHSTEELIEYERYTAKSTIDISEEIQQIEKRLLQSKVNVKAAQKKLAIEQSQKDKFMQKVVNTQLIQCLFCDKVVTTDSKFDLHMQQYHKREFNKKEVNIINQAMQNQLLTQQLSNKIIQQNQQNYLALNYQLLQFTKEQLSRETTDFIQNTMEATEKITNIDQVYIKKIKGMEEEIQNKMKLIQLNAEKEEQIREQQVKDKVTSLEEKIQQEFEKSRFQFMRARSQNKMKTNAFVQRSQEIALNNSQIPNSNSASSPGFHRGQTTMNIASLANIEQDELIGDDQNQKSNLLQFKKENKQASDQESPQQGQIDQSQQLSESIQASQGLIKPPADVQQQQSKFSKPNRKNSSESEEEEQQFQNNNVYHYDNDENIDYVAQNLETFRNAIESQQNMLFELLLNRSKGQRPTCTDLQKQHYKRILQKNIESDIKGIEQNDIKALKKKYDELNKQLKDQQADVEEKLQLYSFNEESHTPEEVDSRRATQFLNIRSRRNTERHIRNLSQK